MRPRSTRRRRRPQPPIDRSRPRPRRVRRSGRTFRSAAQAAPPQPPRPGDSSPPALAPAPALRRWPGGRARPPWVRQKSSDARAAASAISAKTARAISSSDALSSPRARSARATIAIRTALTPSVNADAAIWRPSIASTRTIASISRAFSATLSIDSIEPGVPRARFNPCPATASPSRLSSATRTALTTLSHRDSPRGAHTYHRRRRRHRLETRSHIGRPPTVPAPDLGDSGDPIAEGGLRRCRSRRDNRSIDWVVSERLPTCWLRLQDDGENECSKGRASECGPRPVTQRTDCCDSNSFCQRCPEPNSLAPTGDPCITRCWCWSDTRWRARSFGCAQDDTSEVLTIFTFHWVQGSPFPRVVAKRCAAQIFASSHCGAGLSPAQGGAKPTVGFAYN